MGRPAVASAPPARPAGGPRRHRAASGAGEFADPSGDSACLTLRCLAASSIGVDWDLRPGRRHAVGSTVFAGEMLRRPGRRQIVDRTVFAGEMLPRLHSSPCSRAREARSSGGDSRETRRRLTNRPCASFSKESDSNGRLRVSNWIVQRLYDYAVKKRVELRFLTVFQHVVDPTRVRAVADKYPAMTPLDLRPILANQFLKSKSIAMRW